MLGAMFGGMLVLRFVLRLGLSGVLMLLIAELSAGLSAVLRIVVGVPLCVSAGSPVGVGGGR